MAFRSTLPRSIGFIALAATLCIFALHEDARAQTTIEIKPQSSTNVGNCIPFGNNTFFGFTGFIYRNIPAFTLLPGDKIKFDLGAQNDVDVRRDIFLSNANKNPSPGFGHNVAPQGIEALGWVQVVNEAQTPANPTGNTTKGDYELTYTVEYPFNFAGGGLLVGFRGSPPASYADGNCEQTLVHTNTTDSSGLFYSRFCFEGDLETVGLEAGCGGTGIALGGMVLELQDIVEPPIANAGPDQMVDEGAIVALDGGASFDPQGDPITYSWSQIAGPAVSLSDPAAVSPTFTAPYVSTNQTVTLELVVDDGTDVSDPDTVDVTIKQFNNPPIADAGDDGTIKEGATAALSGALSFDPDGDPITGHQWTQLSGPTVALTPSGGVVGPQFIAPEAAGSVVVLQLQVSDGMEPSALSSLPDPGAAGDDLVSIEIVENSPPVADAGADQTKNEGATVSLDGSASYDPDGGDSIAFAWIQTNGPSVSLDDASLAGPSFVAPPVPPGGETFVFELVATDDDPVNPLSSAADEVVINVANINDPPSCDLAYADPANLWPPNHKMEGVAIKGVMDEDDAYGLMSLTIDGVTQDEPIDNTGDGDTSPDASIVADATADSAMLRRERAGGGNGRVYEVSFTASDGFEDCTGSVLVSVRHDRKRDAIDDGQTVDSTLP